ncbi:MAG TPA: PqiC family protein [Steroidobacteraceae bacterium]|jgi:uncharacterized lipoprotein YmbA|nr:PqiC family protein [Steroidobacteraceae bacterium]
MRAATALGLSLGLGLGLSGCASNAPPMHYYTLSDVAPDTAPPVSHGTGTVPPRVQLAPLALPSELDRQEVVTHSGANQVQVHESNRWASSLDEQIQRTLSNDLASRVPIMQPSMIIDPRAPSTGAPRQKLSISLARLDIDAQCHVALTANWTLQGGGVQGQSGHEQIDQPAATSSACPEGAAATLSQALAVLADRLVPFIMTNTPTQ